MKTKFIVICISLPLIIGCTREISYKGDGQIQDTSYWADGIIYKPQKTILLPSFLLNKETNVEFNVGKIDFYRNSNVYICVRFLDEHIWDHFLQLDSSMKTDQYIAQHKMRDIDLIKGRLQFRVVESGGRELLNSDKTLKSYVWTRNMEAGNRFVEIYNLDQKKIDISGEQNLKIILSYSGDDVLTNKANLVLVCNPK